MLKKILICCLIAVAVTKVYASNYKGELSYKSYKSRKSYKGELPPPPMTKIAAPPLEFIPCSTLSFAPGPYLGFYPGLITNYNRTSSVYKAAELTLFAGYAMLNSNFYLAAELFGQDSAQIQNYRNDLNVNLNPIGLKTTWGLGLSVLPGLIVTDSLMSYLRFGALRTHFNDVAQTITGGQIGLGLEAAVSESWDLRAEYTYTFYQSLSGLGSPRSDAFRLGFLYKFWS